MNKIYLKGIFKISEALNVLKELQNNNSLSSITCVSKEYEQRGIENVR